MQTQNATTAPFFSTWSNFGVANNANTNTNAAAAQRPGSRSRPGTSSGEPRPRTSSATPEASRPNVLTKERRPSLSRKSSFSKRRTSSSNGSGPVTDVSAVPPLPDFAALAATAKLSRDNDAIASPASIDDFSKMLTRTAPLPANGYTPASTQLAPPAPVTGQTESTALHQHIQEMANKRISTLDYLRKAHEGRVYWFNTLLFDKPDLARMPYFDSRKLARRATNYLLLGLSLPTVVDLNSGSPAEFLRSLNTLLAEFDAFQQLHPETGAASGSLSRARLPQMFRRAAPGSKNRRTSSSADIGYPIEPTDGGVGNGGLGGISGAGGAGGGAGSSAGSGAAGAGLISFAASDTDLLPGEEYTHLLTPSLPFDPDFFETFATLCDVLIDCYTRLLSLLPTPRECTSGVAELFTKADSRVRKIIVQGVVKEFEDTSRSGLKTEVANVSKVVLGGLM